MKLHKLDYRQISFSNQLFQSSRGWAETETDTVNTGIPAPTFRKKALRFFVSLWLSPFTFWINEQEEYILSAFCKKIVAGISCIQIEQEPILVFARSFGFGFCSTPTIKDPRPGTDTHIKIRLGSHSGQVGFVVTNKHSLRNVWWYQKCKRSST